MSHLSRPPRGQQRDKPYREALRMELAAAGNSRKYPFVFKGPISPAPWRKALRRLTVGTSLDNARKDPPVPPWSYVQP
jgi:hypothetical protein